MELYLPNPVFDKRKDFKTGRFLKGHQPFNKGLKWEEWMDGRKQKRVKRNLSLKRNGRKDIGGWNKKQVIGIKEGRIFGVFPSAQHAAKKLNIQRRNICHCCNGKRKKAGGVNWFFESDFEKWNKLII